MIFRQAGRAILRFNAAGTLEDYSADQTRRVATERMFEIIGAAIVRLKVLDPETIALITDAQAIIGFRNRLIHGHDSVDHEIVWRTLREKLPLPLQEIEAIFEPPP